MRRVALALMILGLQTAGAEPGPPPDNPILVERRRLLMASVLALAAAQAAGDSPARVALIAWNIDAPDAAPDLIIRTDRVARDSGRTAHAETLLIEAGYERSRRHDPSYEVAREPDSYRDVFAGAALFSVLEPCPMCQSAATMARVPRVYYCVEDRALRDPVTHERRFAVPDELFGRRMERLRLDMPVCAQANEMMWREAAGAPKADFFARALEDLRVAAHPENRAWLDAAVRAAQGQLSQTR